MSSPNLPNSTNSDSDNSYDEPTSESSFIILEQPTIPKSKLPTFTKEGLVEKLLNVKSNLAQTEAMITQMEKLLQEIKGDYR